MKGMTYMYSGLLALTQDSTVFAEIKQLARWLQMEYT
jgi:hypothetical protein